MSSYSARSTTTKLPTVMQSKVSPQIVTQCSLPESNLLQDVAFDVDNVDLVFRQAVRNGAEVVQWPHILRDEHGKVKLASIKTYGDTIHTLVERSEYAGVFLPGYRAETVEDPTSTLLPSVKLEVIDHCVGNQDWDQMEEVCK